MRGQSRVGDLEFLRDKLLNAVLIVGDISIPAFCDEVKTEYTECSEYVQKAEQQFKKLWELRDPIIEKRLERIEGHIEEEKVRLTTKKRELDLSSEILDATTKYFYPQIAASVKDPIHPFIRKKLARTQIVGSVMEYCGVHNEYRDVFVPIRICSLLSIDGTRKVMGEHLLCSGYGDSVREFLFDQLSPCREGNPEYWPLWKEGMHVHVKMRLRTVNDRKLDGMLHESGVWVKAVIVSVTPDLCIVQVPNWSTPDTYSNHVLSKDQAGDLRTFK